MRKSYCGHPLILVKYNLEWIIILLLIAALALTYMDVPTTMKVCAIALEANCDCMYNIIIK